LQKLFIVFLDFRKCWKSSEKSISVWFQVILVSLLLKFLLTGEVNYGVEDHGGNISKKSKYFVEGIFIW